MHSEHTLSTSSRFFRLVGLRSILGLDFHVTATLFFRGWTVLAGGITVVLLPLWLSPVVQGYYYTFSSLLALQIFFELGLNQVIVQLVSHETANLKLDLDGSIKGSVEHIGRLSSVVHLMRNWYAVAAGLFLLSAGPLGVVFFLRKGELTGGYWYGPWALLVLATATNLFLSPALAAMEGMGFVGNVARLRLLQSGVGYIGLWISLALGAGLWAATVTAAVGVVCTSWWIWHRGQLIRNLADKKLATDFRIRWSRDVLPFQWRIAVSWLSGYFVFNLFTPLVFSRFGAVEAGRLGLSLTVFNAIPTIGMSWLSAKNPMLVRLIAKNARTELNNVFRGVLLRSCAVTTGMSLAAIGVIVLVGKFDAHAMTRISTLPVLCCLAWNTIMNSGIFGMAVYMRAHREEPMLPVSVVAGILTVVTALLGVRYGAFRMLLLNAGVTTLIALPWTIVLFRRYYRREPIEQI